MQPDVIGQPCSGGLSPAEAQAIAEEGFVYGLPLVMNYAVMNAFSVNRNGNWLPAPDGSMFVVMQLYWPKETPPSIFPLGSGTWSPPKIVVARQ